MIVNPALDAKTFSRFAPPPWALRHHLGRV
jgi:hypothetical protein